MYERFVVCTSTVDGAMKRQVQQMALTLGGHVVREWTDDCAALVMSQVTVTVKVSFRVFVVFPVIQTLTPVPLHRERVSATLRLRDTAQKMETTVAKASVHTWCSSTSQCK